MDAGFALQVLAVALGGGTVQGLIFLFRRRAEIKELDAKADAIGLEAANNFITRLQLDADQLRQQVSNLRADHLRDVEEMTRRLVAAQEREVRLQREVATLRTDLEIARRQIEQLTPPGGTYYGQHRGGAQ